jgi:hypothetical protein
MPDPVLGYTYRPGAVRLQSGPEFEVEFKISSQGLRDGNRYASRPDPTLTRILVLGDSFAAGFGVEYDATWLVHFESGLKKAQWAVEVVKAGVEGYDTRTELLYLRRIFSSFNPDIVVLVFMTNDLFTNQRVEEEQQISEATLATSSLAASPRRRFKLKDLHSITFAKRLLLGSDYAYCRLYLSSLADTRDFFEYPASPRLMRQMRITEELISEMSAFCHQQGAMFAVFSIPQQFEVLVQGRHFSFPGIRADYVDQSLRDFGGKHDIPWISAGEAMASHYGHSRQSLYFRSDGHLNRDGNLWVAAYFVDAFLKYGGMHPQLSSTPRPRLLDDLPVNEQ